MVETRKQLFFPYTRLCEDNSPEFFRRWNHRRYLHLVGGLLPKLQSGKYSGSKEAAMDHRSLEITDGGSLLCHRPGSYNGKQLSPSHKIRLNCPPEYYRVWYRPSLRRIRGYTGERRRLHRIISLVGAYDLRERRRAEKYAVDSFGRQKPWRKSHVIGWWWNPHGSRLHELIRWRDFSRALQRAHGATWLPLSFNLQQGYQVYAFLCEWF